MEKEDFLHLLPKLIREDDEVKGAIITALSSIMATKIDIEKIIEHSDKRFEAMQKDMDKHFEAMDKRFEAMQKDMDKRFEAMQKDMDKRFEAVDKRFEAVDKRFEELIKQINIGFEQARLERKDLSKKIEGLDIAVGSLGRRSGINLEEGIRNLLNDKLIQANIQTNKIHKEFLFDENGIVFTKNYSTDIDVVIEDGKIILIEVKYSPDNQDIFHFLKIAELYKLKFKPYDELVILGLEMKEHHIEYARQQGIKVIVGKIIV